MSTITQYIRGNRESGCAVKVAKRETTTAISTGVGVGRAAEVQSRAEICTTRAVSRTP